MRLWKHVALSENVGLMVINGGYNGLIMVING